MQCEFTVVAVGARIGVFVRDIDDMTDKFADRKGDVDYKRVLSWLSPPPAARDGRRREEPHGGGEGGPDPGSDDEDSEMCLLDLEDTGFRESGQKL